MMTALTLFLEFFKTGLFAVGGGLATIPFLTEMAKNYPWFSVEQLTDMVAVAESTPGPIGVNMATYAGYSAMGIFGGFFATIGLVTPSVIIILIIAKFLEKFKNSKYVENAFYGIRPAVAGLIIAAALELFKLSVLNDAFKGIKDMFDIKSLIGFLIMTFVVLKFKKINPILLIAIGLVGGIVFKMA